MPVKRFVAFLCLDVPKILNFPTPLPMKAPVIKLKDGILIEKRIEKHYKLDVNGKEIWINQYSSYTNNPEDTDGGTEIFKGKDKLTDEEEESAMEYMDDMQNGKSDMICEDCASDADREAGKRDKETEELCDYCGDKRALYNLSS